MYAAHDVAEQCVQIVDLVRNGTFKIATYLHC